MSTDIKPKELNVMCLVLAMILAFIVFVLFACSPSTTPTTQPTEKRNVQYRWVLINSEVVMFRNGKIYRRKPIDGFVRDSTTTFLFNTTE